LCVAQNKNIWHTNGNWEDDTKGAALYSFQIFTLGLGQTPTDRDTVARQSQYMCRD